MSDRHRKSRLVYSTDRGATCSGCGHSLAACVCSRLTSGSGEIEGPVRVERQVAGRRGKAVTVVRGLGLPPDRLAQLAKTLKQKCGSGGTVKEGRIEIQGEHRDVVVRELRRLGHDAKRSGG